MKKAWATIHKLNPAVAPNQVSHQLIRNGKPAHKAKCKMKQVKQDLHSLNGDLKVHHEQLNTEEPTIAMKILKYEKAASISVEMLLRFGTRAQKWLLDFFNSCIEIMHILRVYSHHIKTPTLQTVTNQHLYSAQGTSYMSE